MPEKIDTVILLKFGKPTIYKLKVGSTVFTVEKTGLHYATKKGDIIYHIFGVVAKDTYFKIELNTKTLNCYLVEKMEVN